MNRPGIPPFRCVISRAYVDALLKRSAEVMAQAAEVIARGEQYIAEREAAQEPRHHVGKVVPADEWLHLNR